ncbi:MAG: hypothetical protein RLZ09_2131, partial [Pseudomonadota bacterium]
RVSDESPSTKKILSPEADSWNLPGEIREISSRFLNVSLYSADSRLAQGVSHKDNEAVSKTMGRPIDITGLIQRIRDNPEANQTIISES